MAQDPDKLEIRQLVDQAKVVLMGAHGLSERDAFRFIQRTAMARKARMGTVAREIIDGTVKP